MTNTCVRNRKRPILLSSNLLIKFPSHPRHNLTYGAFPIEALEDDISYLIQTVNLTTMNLK